jgi:hypothetical protein
MDTVLAPGPPDEGDADLWAALGVETPPDHEGERLAPGLPDEADDLETLVRRSGGRLPGSDPRR